MSSKSKNYQTPSASSQHTPAPWVVDGPSEGNLQIRPEGTGYLLASISLRWFSSTGGAHNALANAHLIAASPKMLEVLEKSVVPYLNDKINSLREEGKPTVVERDLHTKIRRVIAEARQECQKDLEP